MSDEKKRQMPKGGRKGGRQFPQISLKEASEYAKKLVSKTHTGAQAESIILKGVFDSSGPTGKVRASAMKQFGLMDGNADAYKASELAKSLASAPVEEQPTLLRQALLKPTVFSTLYETFKGDKVSSAKIRQQAASHEVHPDNLDKCANLFLESAEFAGVGKRDGDEITLSVVTIEKSAADAVEENLEVAADQDTPPEAVEPKVENQKQPPVPKQPPVGGAHSEHAPSGRSVIHVNIALDSSLDTEKLEKQLELLRRYGAM